MSTAQNIQYDGNISLVSWRVMRGRIGWQEERDHVVKGGGQEACEGT